MNKVLVACATRTGCTAGVADKIGDTLEAEGLDVDVLSVGFKPDPAEYDESFSAAACVPVTGTALQRAGSSTTARS